MTAAHKLASAFVRDFSTLTYESKIAYSRSIVVEYARPWSGNQSRYLNSLLNSDDEYPFLNSVIGDCGLHDSLIELRDKMAAHFDHGYDSYTVKLRGTDIENRPRHGERQPNTIERAFIPISVVVEGSRNLWWIDDLGAVQEIEAHIRNCLVAIRDSMAFVCEEFRDESLNHLHVLYGLDDCFLLRSIETESVDDSGHKSFRFDRAEEAGEQFALESPKELSFGDAKLNMLVARYESVVRIPDSLKVDGRGYILELKTSGDDQAGWNVIFPAYPWPAGKP